MRILVGSLLASSFLFACGGGAAPADGGLELDGSISCRTDPRAETYAAGMTKAGQRGLLRFQLVSATPAPPARNYNTWTVRVTDAVGAAVSNATLTAQPFMPDHGHGTSVAPQIAASGDSFIISSINLFMPGLWQVTLTATAGATTDSAVWSFCIEG